ncbi:hypothetical protein SARC_03086 [Sphaeroforma arctica JP610]|uniref:SGNH hydrolase-type esterase domain-containing protein n=1 Tax=Sphaeroforma arctica JP610 TaxID=667725 RepID=A0A0L0G6R5_9EUKA|nr:hypothetical protein SARC_03086 [Sphaeroforma arctica JP610]KNC84712.1 hypothetical protein SARC_03086 [Sphaeroforma arctica JP610]|eukprot:XP_014158614.1 hypothetical protein SARC_03086 [Sphaeroforma arctica JP610]
MVKVLDTPPPQLSSDFFSRSFDNIATRLLSIEKRDKHHDVPENCKYIPVDAEKIILCGRHQFNERSIKEENFCRIDWPGVYFMLCVTGADVVYVHLAGGANYFNVYVNGMFCRAIGSKYDESTYLLAHDLSPDQVYVVTLVKRTEAYLRTALTYFKPARVFGFSLFPNTAEVLPCPLPTLPNTDPSNASPCRYFEFVGDSDTCAFGVEGHMTGSNSISMDPSTCNIDRSWARVLSRKFGAISHTLAWSGKAISKNPNFLGKATILDMYDRQIANEPDTPSTHAECPYIATNASASSAEIKAASADAVFILGGSNDFLLSPRPTEIEFTFDYMKLIAEVRKRHKTAYICCIVLGSTAVAGVDDGDEESKKPLIDTIRRLTRDAVDKFCELGDDKVYLIDLNDKVDLDKARDFALIMHWNAMGHWKVAAAVERELRQITGWDPIKDENRPRQSLTEDMFNKIDIPDICPTTIRQAWTPVRMPAIGARDTLGYETSKPRSRWGSTRRKKPSSRDRPISADNPESMAPIPFSNQPRSHVPHVLIQRFTRPPGDVDVSSCNKEK